MGRGRYESYGNSPPYYWVRLRRCYDCRRLGWSCINHCCPLVAVSRSCCCLCDRDRLGVSYPMATAMTEDELVRLGKTVAVSVILGIVAATWSQRLVMLIVDMLTGPVLGALWVMFEKLADKIGGLLGA